MDDMKFFQSKSPQPLKNGFGGDPLKTGSYYKLTPAMEKRAKKYGLTKAIETEKKKLLENKREVSKKIATKLFPNEKWIQKGDTVYVAKSREPKNKQEKDKYKKELGMAKIASKYGYCIYLLPENSGDGKKQCDAVMNGELTEFKKVTGGEGAVSKRFKEALDQAPNVYMQIDSKVTPNRTRELLRGVLNKRPDANGDIYCYFTEHKKLFIWKMHRLR
ncbi:MAG: hypothetical protein P1P64_04005 [Treponemataceae bacterium]